MHLAIEMGFTSTVCHQFVTLTSMCSCEQPAPVSTLAALGLSCNKGKTAAMRAAEQGRTEHVIELCRDGSCDVNAATVHGFFSCMQLLKCTGHTPIL